MHRAKWLIVIGLLLAAQSSHGELIIKGVSWDGSLYPNVSQMKELGANSVHPDIVWRQIEPVLLDPNITVAEVDADPTLISGYGGNWTSVDNMIDELAGAGFLIMPRIAVGFTGKLPRTVAGDGATPDELGKARYLGCVYRHVRALVRRHKDRIHHWQLEGELNEARLTVLYGWRHGVLWADDAFLTQLMATLYDAVKTEDSTAEIIIAFHTDIHENLHTDPFASALAGPNHWTDWLVIWKPYLDIVGLDAYPNYYIADPIYGVELGDRVRIAKGIVPDKPVIAFETSYPAPAPGVILPDPVDFTEAKQRQCVEDAVYSAIDEGAIGYFHFGLKSHGVVGGYTAKDLEVLAILGPAFHDGDVDTLITFILTEPDYAQNVLPGVLMKVEGGWGIIRSDDTKRPAFYALQTAFTSQTQQAIVDLVVDWNLISINVEPLIDNLNFVLASIAGRYDEIWTYDPDTGHWPRYIANGPPSLNDLSKIRPGIGYLIKMNQAGTLIVQGSQPATAILLKAGRNLVGYNLQTPKAIQACMAPLSDRYNSVHTFVPAQGWLSYAPNGRPAFLRSIAFMAPGFGYWIDSEEEWLWDVSP